MSQFPLARPRRNRKTEAIRSLVREKSLAVTDLVLPVFLCEGSGQRQPIPSMPDVFRFSTDRLETLAKEIAGLGIPAVALFPAIAEEKKDKLATESTNREGLLMQAVHAIKAAAPGLCVITDVAMDPYSSDGHDGYVNEKGEIENDRTLDILAAMAVAQARAGADMVAPSDMMDGRVGVIREALDENGFADVGILSYAAKYASSFYGPFRDALSSAPRSGDKKTYQMDPGNVREAIREVEMDIGEGADIVMVKPGLPYLDVVRAVSEVSTVPVSVYNVSGEYAMLRAAAERGWLDYRRAVLEALLSFKRAGADMIFTYHAKEAAEWLQK